MKDLAIKYSEVASITTIGKTYEGRDLHVLKVGVPRKDGKTKPAIWIDSRKSFLNVIAVILIYRRTRHSQVFIDIHAREWITSATTTFMYVFRDKFFL